MTALALRTVTYDGSMSVTDPDFDPVQRAERNAAIRALADKQVAAGPTPQWPASSPIDQMMLWDSKTGAPFFAPSGSVGRMKTTILSTNWSTGGDEVDQFFWCVNTEPIEVFVYSTPEVREGATYKFYQAEAGGTISVYAPGTFLQGKWSTTGIGDVLTLTCVRANESGAGGWIGY